MKTATKTLIDLEKKFWQSMVEQDTDAALQLLHEPSQMASSHGSMKFDHAGYRKVAEQVSMVVTAFTLSDFKVLFPSETTAVMAYRVKQTVVAREGGKSATGTVQDMADTSTWIYVDKSWQCMLHTESQRKPSQQSPNSFGEITMTEKPAKSIYAGEQAEAKVFPKTQRKLAVAKNTICLWYEEDAEAAAHFYAATFPDSAVAAARRARSDYPGGKKGDVLTVEFTVAGVACIGINGGTAFKHSEAFSFQIATEDQEETERYWNAIVGNGGQTSECGWCKDRWGLSWQITPRVLTEALAAGGDEARRAFDAMMGMKKIDVAAIKAARLGTKVTSP